MTVAFLALGGLTACGAAMAYTLWPADDPEIVEHIHGDLRSSHPHVRDATPTDEGLKHAHPFVIDDFHREWPG